MHGPLNVKFCAVESFFKYKMKFVNYLTSITHLLIRFNNIARINRNCVVSM